MAFSSVPVQKNMKDQLMIVNVEWEHFRRASAKSDGRRLITKTLHGFAKNFDIPQRIRPWKVFYGTSVPFLWKIYKLKPLADRTLHNCWMCTGKQFDRSPRMKMNASYRNGRCLRVGWNSTSICRHWGGICRGCGVVWHGLAWGGARWVSLLSPSWLQTEDSCKCEVHSHI